MNTPLQRFVLRWGAGDTISSQDSKSEANADSGKEDLHSPAGNKTSPTDRNRHARRRGATWLALALLVVWGGLSTACQETAPQAGVISTENAGRVMGALVRSDSGKLEGVAEIRLVRLDSAGPKLASRTNSDASGAYSFEAVTAGKYRVDADLVGGLRGSSSVFEVKSGKTSNLVVVLVVAHSFQFILVPAANETVLSVWAGDPDHTISKTGQSWSVAVVPGTEMLLGAVLRKASGTESTLRYRLVWRDGAAGLVSIDSVVGAPKVDSVILTAPVKQFGKDSLVAHWVVDSSQQALLKDKTGHGFDLSRAATGVWQHVHDTNLTHKVTGRILYQAKVWLDRYPSSSLHNGRAVVVGFYEGLKLAVNDHGQLQAAGQRGDGVWSWFAPQTKDSAVRLGKWVELAVGADYAKGDMYVWIDGKAVAAYYMKAVSGTKIRIPTSTFVVGQDAVDGQKFDGKIAEVKVWNKFVLGEGLASSYDACIDRLVACTVKDTVKKDTAKKDTVVARHFSIDTNTVALWTFDSLSGSLVKDVSGHGRELSMSAATSFETTAFGKAAVTGTGYFSRAFDTALTPGPTGEIVYEARLFLDKYPTGVDGYVMLGYYAGMRMGMEPDGRLEMAGQRWTGSGWTWAHGESDAGVMPLGRWVDVAVACDQKKGTSYLWVDGKAVSLRAMKQTTGSWRISDASISGFAVGKVPTDDLNFFGKIDEVKISKRIPASWERLSDSNTVVAPRKIDSLVAHWVVDSTNQSKLVDKTGNGFDLSRTSTNVWSRANDTNLTHKVTGRILYQAKVWLDKYPSSSLHNGRAVVVGFYEGLKLAVNDHGQLQAAGQRGDGVWSWFAPETKDNAVPLGKWVELAVGADYAKGDMYVWIDGKAVAAYYMQSVSGTKIRIPTSTFVVGQDAVDGQKFDGKIAEVKVWNKFVLGEGLASGFDACIDRLVACTVKDTTKKDTTVARHFSIDTNTVALWTFDSLSGSLVKDVSGHGRDLSMSAATSFVTTAFGKAAVTGTGYFSRAFDTALTPGPTGEIVYEARLFLDKYPTSVDGYVMLGYYAGMRMGMEPDGKLEMAGQRWTGSGWTWAHGESEPGVMPLGRWVDVAVACDQKTGASYLWVDGKAVSLRAMKQTTGSWRISDASISGFAVGKVPTDNLNFFGKIDEVKISKRIPASWERL